MKRAIMSSMWQSPYTQNKKKRKHSRRQPRNMFKLTYPPAILKVATNMPILKNKALTLEQMKTKIFSDSTHAKWLCNVIGQLVTNGHSDQHIIKHCLSRQIFKSEKIVGFTSKLFLQQFRETQYEWERKIDLAHMITLLHENPSFKIACIAILTSRCSVTTMLKRMTPAYLPFAARPSDSVIEDFAIELICSHNLLNK
eukprot:2610515-Rhodomonas_salina.1